MLSLEDKVAAILGLTEVPVDLQSWRSRVQEGLPADTFMQLLRYLSLDTVIGGKIAGISERTVARKRQQQQRLDSVVSDRLFRVARIAAQAEAVFESQATAENWLKRSNRALGGAMPLELLDTDIGTLQVSDLLGRLEYGVFS
jgi:putative toxin-antitoxin system antitoxin component (TIGR02293 family)